MSFFYRAYGIVFRSNLPLPLPETSEQQTYLTVDFQEFSLPSNPDKVMTVEEASVTDGFQWKVKSGDMVLAKAILHDSNNLKIDYSREFGFETTKDAFLHPLLARILRYRGVTGLHGSVVSHKGSGVVLLGESGQGKSTLASVLVSKGARFLADDVAVLKKERELGWTVQAGANGLRLDSDQADGEARQVFSLQSLPQPEESVKFEVVPLRNSEPAPLKLVVVLCHGTNTSLTELAQPKHKLLELMKQRFGLSLLSPLTKKNDFITLSEIAGQVQVLRLERPRDLSGLEIQAKLITSFLERPAQKGQ